MRRIQSIGGRRRSGEDIEAEENAFNTFLVRENGAEVVVVDEVVRMTRRVGICSFMDEGGHRTRLEFAPPELEA